MRFAKRGWRTSRLSIMLRALSGVGFTGISPSTSVGSQQLIASAKHPGTKLPDGLCERPMVLKQINEEVGVPENATHSQPSRRRRT
jgi:hypothetical protein